MGNMPGLLGMTVKRLAKASTTSPSAILTLLFVSPTRAAGLGLTVVVARVEGGDAGLSGLEGPGRGEGVCCACAGPLGSGSKASCRGCAGRDVGGPLGVGTVD